MEDGTFNELRQGSRFKLDGLNKSWNITLVKGLVSKLSVHDGYGFQILHELWENGYKGSCHMFDSACS